MKKIIILALTVDKGFGGAERVFNKINNSLLSKYEVHECFFNTNTQTYYDSNCQEHSLNVNGSSNFLGSLKNFFTRILKFRKLIKKLDADIVISHLEGADFISLLSGTKAKKICVIHGTKRGDTKIIGIKGIIRKILIKYLYNLSHRLVTVSKALKEEMIHETKVKPSKVLYIYNELNQSLINKKKIEILDKNISHIFANDVLIANSRLDNRQKNLLSLIKIFHLITQKSKKNLKLVLTGDGPDRNKLIKFSKSLNLKVSTFWEKNLKKNDSQIYFVGYQKNPFSLLYNSKFLLLTSFYEGFPLGLIEGLACNNIIVASDCQTGPLEILNGRKISKLNELDLDNSCGILLDIPIINNKNSLDIWVNIILETLEKEDVTKKLIANADITLNKIKPKIIHNQWIQLIEELYNREDYE